MLIVAVLAVAVTGIVFSSDPTTAGAPRVPTKVVQFTIAGKGFRPNTITIKKNTSITFVNVDPSFDHTVTKTAGPGPAFSKEIIVGRNWIKKFALPGTYQYVCSFHGNMQGKIVVTN
jgi:plastocyanin